MANELKRLLLEKDPSNMMDLYLEILLYGLLDCLNEFRFESL